MFYNITKHGYKNKMDMFSRFVVDFFKFAVELGSRPFDEELFVKRFGKYCAWICCSIHSDTKRTSRFGKSMDKWFVLSLSERVEISKAIENDVLFHDNSLEGFRFFTTGLSAEKRQIIRDITSFFYNEYYNHDLIFSVDDQRIQLNRHCFKEEYFNSNSDSFCPVCLHSQTDLRLEGEAEHYLPKSKYPLLSIHPDNLYYACKTCNQTYKKTKDPLSDNGDLSKISMPYDNVQSNIQITINNDKDRKDRIKMTPTLGSSNYTEERIKNLDNLFNLEERWTKDMIQVHKALSSKLIKSDADSWEDILMHKVTDLEDECASNPSKLIEYTYYKWLLANKLSPLKSSIENDVEDFAKMHPSA